MLYICTTAVGKYSFSIQKNKFREGVVRVKTWFVNKPGFITWQILKNETHVYLWLHIADGDESGAQRIYISLFFYVCAGGKCIRAECVCAPCGRGRIKCGGWYGYFY